jgi:hypothetical protein
MRRRRRGAVKQYETNQNSNIRRAKRSEQTDGTQFDKIRKTKNQKVIGDETDRNGQHGEEMEANTGKTYRFTEGRTMKTYAVFHFDDDKKGFERYKFIEDAETDTPEKLAREYYEDEWGIDPNKEVKVSVLDSQITIHRLKFASQTVAYIPRNGGKAIVFAERIKTNA